MLQSFQVCLDNGLALPNADILFFPHLFNQEESDKLLTDLIHTIEWQQDQIQFFGKRIDLPRLTAWYGDEGKIYTYSRISMQPKTWISPLLLIKERVEAAAQTQFSSVLLNRYRNGRDSMAWHSDDEKELGKNPIIASVSFGASRKFKLRHLHNKDWKTGLELTHGSLLLMRGETQHFWQHAIPKTAQKLSERVNLTFRIII